MDRIGLAYGGVLVIFDCDGVLVDSEPISNRSLSEALGAIGLEMTPEECTAELIGRSWKSCVEIIEGRFGTAVPETLEADYRERMRVSFDAELQPVAGVVEVLDALDGVPMCVASSGPISKMEHTLSVTGLLERFDGLLFSATEVERGKPAPDLFLHAAQRMRHIPMTCAVVEDSPVGVAAARAAGMRVIGYAGRTPPDLLADADSVIADVRELLTLPGFAPR